LNKDRYCRSTHAHGFHLGDADIASHAPGSPGTAVSAQKTRAAFLDRDGVINRSLFVNNLPQAPLSIDDFEILPGVAEALTRLRAGGFANVVVTNQPELATGELSRATLDAMHDILRTRLAIDAVYYCGHTDADRCPCRKPRPGMLLEASREIGIDLAGSVMIGDRWRDVGAGQAAGCQCFFLDYGYPETRPEPPYATVRSLPHAVEVILARTIPGAAPDRR
jgi:D-glycero-D-manno-heptose 1,7-bisphosphate phosphatase